MDWGATIQKLAGETESGDMYLVTAFPGGFLAAAIDGLGHGSEAAVAARTAAAILDASPDESVISLMKRCHNALKKTRGAAMSLASFNIIDHKMTWLGVGNVEGVLSYSNASKGIAYKSLLLHSGIVGYHLPPLHPTVIPIMQGDTLIIVTDGIRYNFTREETMNYSTQQIADRIISRYSKGEDDALVLVTRYCGGVQ